MHSEGDSGRVGSGIGGVGWGVGYVWGRLKCVKIWKGGRAGGWLVVTKVQKTLRSSVVGDEGLLLDVGFATSQNFVFFVSCSV